jgi:hypothetical protein
MHALVRASIPGREFGSTVSLECGLEQLRELCPEDTFELSLTRRCAPASLDRGRNRGVLLCAP